jgi:hypothetical protein
MAHRVFAEILVNIRGVEPERPAIIRDDGAV